MDNLQWSNQEECRLYSKERWKWNEKKYEKWSWVYSIREIEKHGMRRKRTNHISVSIDARRDSYVNDIYWQGQIPHPQDIGRPIDQVKRPFKFCRICHPIRTEIEGIRLFRKKTQNAIDDSWHSSSSFEKKVYSVHW